jgi:hypothetical protein
MSSKSRRIIQIKKPGFDHQNISAFRDIQFRRRTLPAGWVIHLMDRAIAESGADCDASRKGP